MNFAKNLLSYFVAKAKRIYGDSFTVYNIHNLLHLADDCQNLHSSLNDISAFKFENYLQVIKKSIRNANNSVAQIAKRKQEVETHCTQMHKKENEIKFSRDLSIGLIPARHCSLISKKILSVEELYRKLVILPCKDSYTVLPMIHCYI